MSYVRDISEPLISTLIHTGGLTVQQLAGHSANLQFWVGEVEHALDVIDGYGDRFKKLRDGERIAAERIVPQLKLFRPEKPVRPSITDHELKELRRRLIDSLDQVLNRCLKEGLISAAEFEEFGERFGLDSRGPRRK